MAAIIAAVLAGAVSLGIRETRADVQVYEEAVRSSVWIVTDSGFGSGVVINSEGQKVVATAYHVVERATHVTCFFPAFDADGEIVTDRTHYQDPAHGLGVTAQVTSADPRRDLAILEPSAIPESVLGLSLAQRVPVGSQIHIIGNSPVAPLFGYMTGTVRGVFRPASVAQVPMHFELSAAGSGPNPIAGMYFTTDAPVNLGDSGAPVLHRNQDNQLELVGLVQSFSVGPRMVSNVIHVKEVAQLLAEPMAPPRREAEVNRKWKLRMLERYFELQSLPKSLASGESNVPEDRLTERRD